MADKMFDDLLETYGLLQYRSGRTGDWLTQEIEQAEQALRDHVARLEARQITPEMGGPKMFQSACIRLLYVHEPIDWLAGFIKGREPSCDTFWRKDFPNGITQTVDELPFNASAKAEVKGEWDTLLMMINTLFDEGYTAVRVIRATKPAE